MKDSRSGEKCLRQLDLNINLYLTLNYVTGSEEHNSSYAEYRIWIGLVRPIPRSSRKFQYRSDTDPEYQIGTPLVINVTLELV